MQIQELFDKYTNGKYLSKKEMKYRIQTNKVDFNHLWEEIILLRKQKSTYLPLSNSRNEPLWFMTPPFFHKKLNQIDSVAKRKLEEIASKDIQKDVIVESIFDEAYYSSVIEGAFSTKKRAKEVIQYQNPKDKSEKMILNNFQAMMYVLDHIQGNIDEKCIIALHQILTKDTLKDEDITDKYRTGPVYVKNDHDEVVYEGPAFELVEDMMKTLIKFINQDEDAYFIHPIIKASIIHFSIGYIHPFYDGNGRLARALSYMYLIKHGYDFFKFFSISSIIAKHRAKYYNSYLQSEETENGNDLTYFIVNQGEMIAESIQEVIDRLSCKYNQDLLKQKLQQDQIILSKRQEKFLSYMEKKKSNMITIADYQKVFKVAYETARADLSELESLGILNKLKKGKKFIFTYQGVKGYLNNS